MTVPLPDKPLRVGRPRLGAYQKLLGRFYEVLFLLKALNQTREQRTPFPPAPSEDIERQRRFGRCLAYLCDTTKGGPTTTAIGIEESGTDYYFWVASNVTASSKAPASSEEWLGECLKFLKRLGNEPVATQTVEQDAFLSRCINQARHRIGRYKYMLFKNITQVQNILSSSTVEHDRDLSTWLDVFKKEDTDLELCSVAYRASKSINMKVLKARGLQEKKRQALHKNPFEIAKHCIGRLAYHIRVHKCLMEDLEAPNIKHLLLHGKACPVKIGPCTPSPERDSHTNLQGILNRSVRTGESKEEIAKNIWYRHTQCRMLDDFVGEYDSFRPQIHAEIQVNEYFYQNGLKFAGGDKYIACSKPACQACFLYLKFHRARMVVPESHHKIWPNWSLPVIENFRKGDPKSDEQRDLVNNIRERLREDLISQILGCSVPPNWHADTSTAVSDFDFMHAGVSDVRTTNKLPDLEEVEFTDWDFCDGASATSEPTDSETHSDANDNDGDGSDSDSGGVSIRRL